MTTWGDVIAKESKLWNRRLEIVRESGKTVFSYKELGELWGIGKNGAWTKANAWMKIVPQFVYAEKSDAISTPYEIHFIFEGEGRALPEPPTFIDEPESLDDEVPDFVEEMEPEPEVEEPEPEATPKLPPFITSERVFNETKDRLDALNVLDENCILRFEKMGEEYGRSWDIAHQRGSLRTVIVQSDLPVLEAVGCYDNGFLVSKLTIRALNVEK
jgi:hypothetical protein